MAVESKLQCSKLLLGVLDLCSSILEGLQLQAKQQLSSWPLHQETKTGTSTFFKNKSGQLHCSETMVACAAMDSRRPLETAAAALSRYCTVRHQHYLTQLIFSVAESKLTWTRTGFPWKSQCCWVCPTSSRTSKTASANCLLFNVTLGSRSKSLQKHLADIKWSTGKHEAKSERRQ